MARPSRLDLSSRRCHWWVPIILAVNQCETICTGYILAITANNNRTRYIAVFLMATGVFVFFSFFSRILTHWNQISVILQYHVSCRCRSMLILASATDNNCCSSILPNNSSGHYKKASTVALQVVIGNLRCVLSLWIFWHRLQFICVFTFLVASWLPLLIRQVRNLCYLLRVVSILNAWHDRLDQKPKYIRGHIISLCFIVFSWILIAFNV